MNDWHQERQLYGSPYSGCRCFTGWAKAPYVRMPVQTSWPSPYNAPGAILCADRYRKTWKAPGTPASPKYGPARATFTSMTPTQAGRFVCAGPSSRGPFTYAQSEGICWGGQNTYYVRSGGTGQNSGLT